MTNLETVTLVTAITGAACGTLGAVLGIINTFVQLGRLKVKLRVIPKVAFPFGHSGAIITADRHTDSMDNLLQHGSTIWLCVEVVNLSAFPVTVHDVGFGSGDDLRHPIIKPDLTPTGKTWPARLESREAITAYAAIGDLGLDPTIIKRATAYATTDCGTVVQGSSPIYRMYVRAITAQEHTARLNTKEARR